MSAIGKHITVKYDIAVPTPTGHNEIRTVSEEGTVVDTYKYVDNYGIVKFSLLVSFHDLQFTMTLEEFSAMNNLSSENNYQYYIK